MFCEGMFPFQFDGKHDDPQIAQHSLEGAERFSMVRPYSKTTESVILRLNDIAWRERDVLGDSTPCPKLIVKVMNQAGYMR